MIAWLVTSQSKKKGWGGVLAPTNKDKHGKGTVIECGKLSAIPQKGEQKR
jgi:hypothetical protein